MPDTIVPAERLVSSSDVSSLSVRGCALYLQFGQDYEGNERVKTFSEIVSEFE